MGISILTTPVYMKIRYLASEPVSKMIMPILRNREAQRAVKVESINLGSVKELTPRNIVKPLVPATMLSVAIRRP